MGDKMQALSRLLKNDPEVAMSVCENLLSHRLGHIPWEVVRNLEDPGDNLEVRAMLRNVIRFYAVQKTIGNPPAYQAEIDSIRERFIEACRQAGIDIDQLMDENA